jgi:ribosomal protein L11 methyltransferase
METSSFSHRPARTWQKVTLEVDPCLTDAVTTFLTDLTGSGIEISSLDRSTGQPNPHETTMDKITGYILCNEKGTATELEQLRAFLDELHTFFPDCPAPRIAVDTIQEEDWGKTWKEFFTAYQITPRLIIRPSWEKPGRLHANGQSAVATIEMDPGLAFGTGHHASTQLALSLIDQLFLSRQTHLHKVLDVGTGSGILAMACALFGAREVLAIDNDPDAVETAQNNIAINLLESIITVSAVDVTAVQPAYNLIAANITHDTLAKLAPALVHLLAEEGHLILAGILKNSQENSIVKIFTGLGLTHHLTEAKEEWVALKFMKT